jgi:hypothetical protein
VTIRARILFLSPPTAIVTVRPNWWRWLLLRESAEEFEAWGVESIGGTYSWLRRGQSGRDVLVSCQVAEVLEWHRRRHEEYGQAIEPHGRRRR